VCVSYGVEIIGSVILFIRDVKTVRRGLSIDFSSSRNFVRVVVC